MSFSGDIFSLLENPRIYFDDKYNDELIEYFFNNTNQHLSFIIFNSILFSKHSRQSRIIGRWINLDKKNKNNNYSKYLDVTTKRLKKKVYTIPSKPKSYLNCTVK